MKNVNKLFQVIGQKVQLTESINIFSWITDNARKLGGRNVVTCVLQTMQNLRFNCFLCENTKIFHLLDFLRLDRICICFQLLKIATFYNHHECLWISVPRVSDAFSFFMHIGFSVIHFSSIKTIDDSVKTAFIRALLTQLENNTKISRSART